MTPLKTFRMTLVSFNLAVVLDLLILQDKHNIRKLSLNIRLIYTRQRLGFLPVSKARANKLYLFRQCTDIVYIQLFINIVILDMEILTFVNE